MCFFLFATHTFIKTLRIRALAAIRSVDQQRTDERTDGRTDREIQRRLERKVEECRLPEGAGKEDTVKVRRGKIAPSSFLPRNVPRDEFSFIYLYIYMRAYIHTCMYIRTFRLRPVSVRPSFMNARSTNDARGNVQPAQLVVRVTFLGRFSLMSCGFFFVCRLSHTLSWVLLCVSRCARVA